MALVAYDTDSLLKEGFCDLFEELFLKKLPHGEIFEASLWSRKSGFLVIRSQMIDVGERAEIGVLKYFKDNNYTENVGSGCTIEKIKIHKNFLRHRKFYFMSVNIYGNLFKSGIFIGSEDEELILVPSVNPFCLYVSMKSILMGTQPEFPLADYIKQPI